MRTAPPRAQALSAAVCAALILFGPVTQRASAAEVAAAPAPSAAAAAAPSAAGPSPLEQLRNASRQPERLRTEQTVGRMQDPAVVSGLIEALSDPDLAFRTSAAGALGWSRDPRGLDPLQTALNDSEPWMRQRAAVALGRLNDQRAVEALAAALEDADRGVQSLAAKALGDLGGQAAAAALARVIERVVFTTSPNRAPEVPIRATDGLLVVRPDYPAQAAAEALRSMKDPLGRETLLRLLRDGSPTQREVAANLIRKVPDSATAAALVESLRHSDAQVRSLAASCLATSLEPQAVEPLAAALADADASVRRAAAFSLSSARDRQGAGDPRAIDKLVAALGDPDAQVREAAVSSLQMLGERRAARQIATLLRDPEPRVRMIAAAAVGQLGYTDAAEALAEALKDGDDGVRRAAKASLKTIGAPAPAPVPPAPAPPPPNLARPLRARDVSVLLKAVSAALSDAPTVTVGSVELAAAAAGDGSRASANLLGKSASPGALQRLVAALGKSPSLKSATQFGGKPVSADASGPLTFLVSATLADRPGEPLFSPLPPNMRVRREIGRAAEAAGLGMLQQSPGGAPPQAPEVPKRDVLLIEAGGELPRLIRFFDALATLPELVFSGIVIRDVMREGGGRPESVFTASFSASIPTEERR